MTKAQPLIEVELDPENPAQFFACCGLFELAAMFGVGVEAAFDYAPSQPRNACFRLIDSALSLNELMTKLKEAKASTLEDSGEAPVTLHFSGGATFTLDWWLLPDRSEKSPIKLWAGRQQTLRDLVEPMLKTIGNDLDKSILDQNVPMKGRFGFDPRSSWNTRDFGSSPDAQNARVLTYSITEILAAIGLQGFRANSGNVRKKFAYRLWRDFVPLSVARAAAAGVTPISGQTFSFTVEKRSGAYSCFAFAHPTQGA